LQEVRQQQRSRKGSLYVEHSLRGLSAQVVAGSRQAEDVDRQGGRQATWLPLCGTAAAGTPTATFGYFGKCVTKSSMKTQLRKHAVLLAGCCRFVLSQLFVLWCRCCVCICCLQGYPFFTDLVTGTRLDVMRERARQQQQQGGGSGSGAAAPAGA
jgi:hypothetical protein